MSNEEARNLPAVAGGELAPVQDWTQTGELETTDRAQFDPRDAEGEQYDLDEIKLPRLLIAQGLSPQLIPGTPEYVKGLAVGDMFNDVTGEVYGPGPLKVVPFYDHTTRIEFDPNDRRVPLDRNVPKNDPRMRWEGNNPPRATEFVEMYSLIVRPGKAPEPVVVTIKTTNKHQTHAAKMWRTFIQQRGRKIYTGVYELTTMIARGKNREGQDTMYGHFIVKNAGTLDPSKPVAGAILAMARELHVHLTGGTKTINVSPLSGDEDAAAEREAIQQDAHVPF